VRVRVRKKAVINRPTQIGLDMTAPIRVQKARRKTRWDRMRQRLAGWLMPAPKPEPVSEYVAEGLVVQWMAWDEWGAPVYRPFPQSALSAIDYDLPLAVYVDERAKGGDTRVWCTSPIRLVKWDPDHPARPWEVETASSIYEITWLEPPLLPNG